MTRKTTSIFIGGAGHSGTTMLFKIFSKHPKALKIASESRVAETYELLEKQYQKLPSAQNKLRFLEETSYYGSKFKKSKYEYEKSKINPLKDNLNSNSIKSRFDLDYQLLIEKSLEKHQLDFIVEKTPSNIFHVKELQKISPDFKLIIIHRDVRDVVASLKKRYLTLIENPEVFSHNLSIKKLDKDYNLVIDALIWNKIIRKSYADLETYGDSKIKIVKYEDLVKSPERMVKSFCKWLNIEYYPTMIELQGRNSAIQSQKNNLGINESSVGNYKKVLNTDEIALAEKYAKTGMVQLGIMKNITKSNKLNVLKYEIISYFKIVKRVFKRLMLMNPRYAFDFSKRFIRKLMIR
jgi:hypothetical protein